MISWCLGDRVPLGGEDLTLRPDCFTPLENEDTESAGLLFDSHTQGTRTNQRWWI